MKPGKSSNLRKCDECHWPYPTHYTTYFDTNLVEYRGKYVCGICALEMTNKVHGVIRLKFDGEFAEKMRLAAIQWREKHPYDNPERVKK